MRSEVLSLNNFTAKVWTLLKKVSVKIWQFIKVIFNKIKPSLLAIGIGISIGFVVMLIFNPSGAFPGLLKIILGGLQQGQKGIGDVMYHATPIILTGLAVVIAFKTGLFNIGASGQMIIGGYVAIHIGVLWNIPSPFHWMVSLILGTLAGAIWGAVPGILKAISNTNEVIVSILMNYIGTLLVVYLVKSNVYNGAYAKSKNIQLSANLPKLGAFFGSSAVTIGFIIAIVMAILIHYLFKRTTLGYELQASGFNKDASEYAGMSSKRNIITAMIISGAMAGLAGAIQFSVIGNNLGTTTDLLGAGFDGISVGLLGLGEPIGAIFAGLFLSNVRQGGFYMQINGFPPQIIDIIIAIIVYVTSISAGISFAIKKRKLAHENKVKVKGEKAND